MIMLDIPIAWTDNMKFAEATECGQSGVGGKEPNYAPVSFLNRDFRKIPCRT